VAPEHAPTIPVPEAGFRGDAAPAATVMVGEPHLLLVMILDAADESEPPKRYALA
jgi:hypothetical protein